MGRLWLSAVVGQLLIVLLYLFYFFSLPQSVYGLQNDIRTHSPTHTPAPEAKQPTEEELQEQVRSAGGALLLQIQSSVLKCNVLSTSHNHCMSINNLV